MDSNINKHNEIISMKNSFIALAIRKLTKKEISAIKTISTIRSRMNSTQIVKVLSEEISCAESTAWMILRSLIKMKLVILENKKNNVTLTKAGEILIDSLS